MARFMFERGKAELLRQSLDENLHGTTKLFAQAIDTGEHAIAATDEFMSDVAAGAKEGSPVQMTNVTVSDDGEVDFDDFTFPSLSGASVEGIAYYMTHTALGEDLLLYYDDNADFTPDGNDVDVSYSSYVFKL